MENQKQKTCETTTKPEESREIYAQIEHKLPPRENQKVAIDDAILGLTENGFHGMLLEMSLGKTKCALNTAEIPLPTVG